MADAHNDPSGYHPRRVSGSVSAPIWRALDHVLATGMGMDQILEIALTDWVRRNNLTHIMMPVPKTEKPPPRFVGRPPNPPKPVKMKRPAQILGLMRNEKAKMIFFEVRRIGCAIDRVRFLGWDEAIDARVQLVRFVPVGGMARWEDLVGRTVDIKPSNVPGEDGTLLPRPQADIDADIAWLEQQDLDAADRAALASVRETK